VFRLHSGFVLCAFFTQVWCFALSSLRFGASFFRPGSVFVEPLKKTPRKKSRVSPFYVILLLHVDV